MAPIMTRSRVRPNTESLDENVEKTEQTNDQSQKTARKNTRKSKGTKSASKKSATEVDSPSEATIENKLTSHVDVIAQSGDDVVVSDGSLKTVETVKSKPQETDEDSLAIQAETPKECDVDEQNSGSKTKTTTTTPVTTVPVVSAKKRKRQMANFGAGLSTNTITTGNFSEQELKDVGKSVLELYKSISHQSQKPRGISVSGRTWKTEQTKRYGMETNKPFRKFIL